MIPNLGDEPGRLELCEKKIMAEKGIYVNSLNVNMYALSVHLIIPLLFNPTIGLFIYSYEGWNFNSGNYLFTTDTKYE